MRVFERSELQNRLIYNMRARSSEVTYFGPGPIRAFFYAVAVELQHLYYRLFRADLKQDAIRALGSDLDEIASSRGLSRLGATPSSVVLDFTGTIGTTIPIGFQVRSASGVTYATTEAGTVATTSSNPGSTATKRIVAQSTTSGSGSTAIKGSVNQIVSFSSVTGGTLSGVVNLAPSVGGADAESDEQLRSRVVKYLASLNHGTRAFYDAQVRAADPTVVRTYVGRGANPHTVKVLVASRSGASYGSSQLQAIAAAIGPNIPVLSDVTVDNLVFTGVSVQIVGTIKSGFVVRDVIEQVAASMNRYLDWSTWDFGTDVQWDNLLTIASTTPGVDKVTAFTPTTDVPVPVGSLPKLISISFIDSTSAQITTLGAITTEFPRL